MVKAKYEHTLRVATFCLGLANSLSLSNEDTDLAYLIDILHDIGRFEEIKLTKSFSSKKVDHAKLGVDILSQGLLRKFITTTEYDSIILTAISMHNKANISGGLNTLQLLHTRIIRDADKIDILYNICNKLYDFGYDNFKLQTISRIVKNNALNHNIIDISDVRCPLDMVVARICFVYDINFKYSLFKIYSEDYLGKYINLLTLSNEQKQELLDIKNVAYEYMKNKINKNTK